MKSSRLTRNILPAFYYSAVLLFFVISCSGFFLRFDLLFALRLSGLGISSYILCTPFFGGGVIMRALSLFLIKLDDYLFELIAWTFALLYTGLTLYFDQSLYQYTGVTHFLHRILTNPNPYWLILGANSLPVLLSGAHKKFKVITHPGLYYLAHYFLIIFASGLLYTIAYKDFVFISNIHA